MQNMDSIGIFCGCGNSSTPSLSVAVDLTLITAEIAFYKSQLGLSEEGSERFRMLNAQNQERVRKFCLTTATQVASLLT